MYRSGKVKAVFLCVILFLFIRESKARSHDTNKQAEEMPGKMNTIRWLFDRVMETSKEPIQTYEYFDALHFHQVAYDSGY